MKSQQGLTGNNHMMVEIKDATKNSVNIYNLTK